MQPWERDSRRYEIQMATNRLRETCAIVRQSFASFGVALRKANTAAVQLREALNYSKLTHEPE